jgi:polyhydroxyalkanoate synthesis regulator phasin
MVMDMLDDLRTYLQMATGITEATTAKAKDVVTGLLASGMSLTTKAGGAPEMVGQVQDLADDLVATSRNNRELLTGVIRAEVDKAVGRMGFVREDELAALRRHVQRLESEMNDLRRRADEAPAPVVNEPSAPAEEPGVPESAPEAAAKPKKKKVLVDPEAQA